MLTDCEICGAPCLSVWRTACCAAHAEERVRRREERAMGRRPRRIVPVRQCGGCGQSFRPHGSGRHLYCSDGCRLPPRAATIRAVKPSVRARRRGAAEVEYSDPFVVFERDRWECYVCGKPTPIELRGTCHSRAP